MADLMTDAYEYESLRKTYKNFTTPAVKFKIGGTDVIQKKELQVLSVETTLSLNSAGSARIVLGGCYDYKNGSFDKTVKDLGRPGKRSGVSLGYVSSFQKVFKGVPGLGGDDPGRGGWDHGGVYGPGCPVADDDGQFPLPGAYGKKLFRRSPGDHEAVQKAVQREK